MKNIGHSMEAYKDMPVVLDGIASGEYFAVTIAYRHENESVEENQYMHMIDFMNPYYKITFATFEKRSQDLQLEGMEKGIFFDECCYNC